MFLFRSTWNRLKFVPAVLIIWYFFHYLPTNETVWLSVARNLGMATLWTETNDPLSLPLSQVLEVDHLEQTTYLRPNHRLCLYKNPSMGVLGNLRNVFVLKAVETCL
jgi:hypothetical protein